MAKRRNQNAISLFPFLAVLVCTMGALILLLLVTTRQIRHQQAATTNTELQQEDDASATDLALPVAGEVPLWVEADKPQKISVAEEAVNIAADPFAAGDADSQIAFLPEIVGPDSDTSPEKTAESLRLEVSRLKEQLADADLRQTELADRIRLVQKEVDEHQDRSERDQLQLLQLNSLRQQERDLKEELDQKQQQLLVLQSELDECSKTTEQGERILHERQSALVALREMAEDAQDAAATGSSRTVIEFSNSSGTSREPIVIEVTDSGFLFLPSKVKITQDDLKGFPGNDNPFLAAIIALHESRHGHSITSQPYVLLLVRPEGSLGFYVAQRHLRNSGIHFGYELLDAERNVAVKPHGSDDANVLRRAILAALNRRHELYGGLMAQVEALRKRSDQDARREMQVLPDGRVVMSEDGQLSANQGRYYAGGEAPVPQLAQSLSDGWQQPRQTPPMSTEPQATDWPAQDHGENEPIQEQLATTTTENTAEAATAPLLSELLSNSPASAPQDGFEQVLTEGVAQSQVPEIGEQQTTVSVEDPATPAVDPIENTDAQSLFPERSLLAGNLGVGGAMPATNQSQTEHRTGSREPSGWSNKSTATQDSTSRTAGLAENSSSSGAPAFKLFEPEGSETTAGNPSSVPASDTQGFLDKFLQAVEAEKETPQPNPFLLTLLKKGMQRRETQTAPGVVATELVKEPVQEPPTASPANSVTVPPQKPVAPAVAKKAKTYVVEVTIQPKELAIGSFEPIDISGWDREQILAMVFEGLNGEIELMEESGVVDSIPGVSIRVAPGMKDLQTQLSRELLQVDVPTVAVEIIGGTTIPDATATEPLKPPAEPVETAPAKSQRGRGLSI